MDTHTADTGYTSKRRPAFGTDEIILTVARYYGLTKAELTSKTRRRKITRPRQVAMYLSKQLLIVPGWQSYPKVAERFGGKDHSTVMHSAKKIEDLKSRDDGVRVAVETLSEHIERVERESHGLVDENGQPIAPLDYIHSQRYLVAKPPDSPGGNATPSPAFTPPNQKIVSVRVEVIQRIVAEYYEVNINWHALRDTEDDFFYQQVFDYLATRLNRECWLRAQVSDNAGRYRAPESSLRAIAQLLEQARKDMYIRRDLEALWNTMNTLIPPPA